MAYQLYRNTTLGNSLQESLDELIQSQQITPQLALQVLLQFDKAINSALAQRVRNRVNFRGSLNTYRFCDNVWTFVLNDVEFREVTELIKVDKVKIVACDGKTSFRPLLESGVFTEGLLDHLIKCKTSSNPLLHPALPRSSSPSVPL
ncbi:transcription initiation factor IIA subunit 2 isoform X1 [Arvicanthis niloticus]|uniref:transcription initiation factor IIA subunit 2 isoform X1 n=1 Tax=Arvicanthis niloticus TaxID=61156 RepID=UPI00402B7C23